MLPTAEWLVVDLYTWSCDAHCRTCLTEREMLAGHASIYHRSNYNYKSTELCIDSIQL